MTGSQSSDGTLRTLLIVLAVVLGAPLVLMVVALPLIGAYGGMMGGYGGYGGMMGGYGGYSPLWGLGMLLVPLLVLLAVAYLAYRALGGRHAASSDRALEELRVAYARGDLSDEEYETRRATLREDGRDGE
ncbi:MAG: SHOCT domain-containing protein [Halarchaeum sp.]